MRFGHRPDSVDPRDRDAAELLSAVKSPSGVLDLRDTDSPIWDQGGLGSCVAQAMAGAVCNRSARLGNPLVKPSTLAFYSTTLAFELGPAHIKDEGLRPRDAAKMLRTFGLVPESRWPYDESKVTTPPPWDVYQHGADARVAGFSKIVSTGDHRAELILKALSSGFPVPFAQQCDQAFMDYDGSSPIGAFAGGALGGHMTTIVGYDQKRDVFIVRNSWGTSWGISGYYEMTPARLDTAFTSDFYVMTLAGDDPYES